MVKKIEFTGVPFYILDCKILDCQHGKDGNAALKRKKQQQREEVSVHTQYFIHCWISKFMNRETISTLPPKLFLLSKQWK